MFEQRLLVFPSTIFHYFANDIKGDDFGERMAKCDRGNGWSKIAIV